MSPTHYETLGVSPAASGEEIKKRFRELARKLHPDVSTGNESRFREINSAYQILSNADKRLFYDAELKLAALKQPTSSASSSSTTDKGGTKKSAADAKSSSRGGSRSAGEARRRKTETVLDEARKAMRRMRYRDAESLCREALRLERRNVQAYEILGDIRKTRGDIDEAIAMYSYALQLDRSNASVRSKFDKLVGQRSGPTMAGHAARSSRGLHRHHQPVLGSDQARLVASGILIGTITLLLLAVASLPEAVPGLNPLGWSWLLFAGLVIGGAGGGLILTINRSIPRCSRQLGSVPRLDDRGPAIPIGLILVGFSAVWFYAGMLAYLAIALARRSVLPGVTGAYCWSLAIVVLFAFAARSSGGNVLLVGGNIVFLAFVAGWAIGDTFRSRVH
jgi:curved DNA-binding protein CbpA